MRLYRKSVGNEALHISKQVTVINSKLNTQPKMRSSNSNASRINRTNKSSRK